VAGSGTGWNASPFSGMAASAVVPTIGVRPGIARYPSVVRSVFARFQPGLSVGSQVGSYSVSREERQPKLDADQPARSRGLEELSWLIPEAPPIVKPLSAGHPVRGANERVGTFAKRSISDRREHGKWNRHAPTAVSQF
jgi:hypothetical protein